MFDHKGTRKGFVMDYGWLIYRRFHSLRSFNPPLNRKEP